MQAMIFYEDWQMDCCGDPFAIGDDVNWVCVKGDDGALVACDYYYDAHADEYAKQFYITGQVMDITQINFRYELKAGVCQALIIKIRLKKHRHLCLKMVVDFWYY